MLRRPLLPPWRYWPGVVLAALVMVIILGPSLSPTRVSNHTNIRNEQGDGHEGTTTSETSAYVRTFVFFEDHNSAITAIATALLAVVTGGLVWVAYVQLRTTRRELRAYVSATPFFLVAFDQNVPPAIRIALKNVGVTPAFQVQNRSQIEILTYPYTEGTKLPPLSGTFSPPTVVFPNDELMGITTKELPFSKEQIEEIRNGTMLMHVYGEIKYRTFGRCRRTFFCRSVIADSDTMKKLTSSYEPDDLKLTFRIAPMDNHAT